MRTSTTNSEQHMRFTCRHHLYFVPIITRTLKSLTGISRIYSQVITKKDTCLLACKTSMRKVLIRSVKLVRNTMKSSKRSTVIRTMLKSSVTLIRCLKVTRSNTMHVSPYFVYLIFFFNTINKFIGVVFLSTDRT